MDPAVRLSVEPRAGLRHRGPGEKVEQDLLDLDGAEQALLQELCQPRWSMTASGKIKVEPMDEIRKRVGRAPDDADARLLVLYHGGGEAIAVVEPLTRMGKIRAI